MRLQQLRLLGFRNYESLSLNFNSSVNIIIGPNGSGKTNLLESIQFLLNGKSFRQSRTENLLNKEIQAQQMAVQGKIQRGAVNHSIVAKYDSGRKSLQMDSKRISANKCLETFRVVLFSPESLSVIKAGPSERRDLLDEVLLTVNPGNVKLLADYSRSVRQRNKLLKELSEKPTDESLISLLASLNQVFLPLATELSYKRLQALRILLPKFTEISKKILKNQSVDIAVDYVISGQSAIDWDENQVYDAQTLRLKQLAQAEMATGQSLVGPHKHDVRFLFNGEDSRSYCSQGQQRSLVLALKIAQVQLHKQVHGLYPILLLDDVLSELDPVRQASLLGLLQGLEAQIFLTNTTYDQRNLFSEKEVSVFNVDKGRIESPIIKKDEPSVRQPNASL